jgi:hypothetical protein
MSNRNNRLANVRLAVNLGINIVEIREGVQHVEFPLSYAVSASQRMKRGQRSLINLSGVNCALSKISLLNIKSRNERGKS